jgi:hypothetical protein
VETSEKAVKQDFFDLIYGVLFNAAATFRNLADAPPIGQAALVLFILTLSNGIVSLSFFRLTFSEIPGVDPVIAQVLTGAFPVLLLLALVFAGLRWFISGAVLHLLAELLGGRGSPKGTLTVCALAGLPGIFLVPVELLVRLLEVPETAAVILTGLTGFVTLGWGAVLLVIGLRETHRFSGGNAVLTIIAPVTVFILISVLVAMTILFTLTALVPFSHSL